MKDIVKNTGQHHVESTKNAVSGNKAATFEEAVTATKFGKFNVILILLTIPAGLCAPFDTATMSFTFVAAQCDLNLSLNHKGLLNAIVYAGMISSALIWGFLFDVLGRKKLLIIGFLVDSVFVFLSAFSQSLGLLIVCKYFQGFIVCGPMAVLYSYLSEFHSTKYRSTCQLIIGMCNSFGILLLPAIAWLILPHKLDFSVHGYNFHSWNIFLLVSGLPAFASGILYLFLPESPKFLMACGRNEKALEVFRTVYSLNTGLPKDSYPITELIDETKLNLGNKHGGQVTANRTKIQALKEGFQQIRPLFFPPHLVNVILSSSIMFFVVMGLNILRLWLPQIFQTMTDYQLMNNNSTASLCTMLEIITPSNSTSTEECVVNTDNSSIYINSMIVGSATLSAFFLAGTLIKMLGKKPMMVITASLAGGSCIGIYFSQYSYMVVIFSSIFQATSSISSNLINSVTVDLFPTTQRTLAISFGMMNGRVGAMLGNFVFPYLLASGCIPPFFTVAGIMFVAAFISLFVPRTDKLSLR
ncbi:synaptic vesicle glycoprotein 2B-like isoform X1 [Rhynchophorus ferrugineus]|uniref:synaptic vesicle glycoprotein 2B-like isoform X1 n=1 Tax=Rhynchophorus ferrugineus TaxID=354439 RepID=UPI003FCCDB79